MNRRANAVADFEERLGHRFADRDLIERALTHASVGNGGVKVGHNERLEFLGDRVLNLLAAERLTQTRPSAREGELSRWMNQLVNYHACAEVARQMGVRDALRVDASATKVGARDNDRVLGDACEAVMAELCRYVALVTALEDEGVGARAVLALDTPEMSIQTDENLAYDLSTPLGAMSAPSTATQSRASKQVKFLPLLAAHSTVDSKRIRIDHAAFHSRKCSIGQFHRHKRFARKR